MIIYIVIHEYDYEGFEIDGVFDSKEAAEEFKSKIRRGDNQAIIEWELNTFRDDPFLFDE